MSLSSLIVKEPVPSMFPPLSSIVSVVILELFVKFALVTTFACDMFALFVAAAFTVTVPVSLPSPLETANVTSPPFIIYFPLFSNVPATLSAEDSKVPLLVIGAVIVPELTNDAPSLILTASCVISPVFSEYPVVKLVVPVSPVIVAVFVYGASSSLLPLILIILLLLFVILAVICPALIVNSALLVTVV